MRPLYCHDSELPSFLDPCADFFHPSCIKSKSLEMITLQKSIEHIQIFPLPACFFFSNTAAAHFTQSCSTSVTAERVKLLVGLLWMQSNISYNEPTGLSPKLLIVVALNLLQTLDSLPAFAVGSKPQSLLFFVFPFLF